MWKKKNIKNVSREFCNPCEKQQAGIATTQKKKKKKIEKYQFFFWSNRTKRLRTKARDQHRRVWAVMEGVRLQSNDEI